MISKRTCIGCIDYIEQPNISVSEWNCLTGIKKVAGLPISWAFFEDREKLNQTGKFCDSVTNSWVLVCTKLFSFNLALLKLCFLIHCFSIFYSFFSFLSWRQVIIKEWNIENKVNHIYATRAHLLTPIE